MRGRTARLLLVVIAFTFAFAVSIDASAQDTLPQRLLRTVQIGAPQDITVDQIRKIAESNETDYTTAILARSALLVLHQDDPKLNSYDELLDNLLNHLVSDGTPFQPLPGLPSFRGKESVFTMVYAMVMSGNQERVVDMLEKHSLTGSRYKQAVVLSALRNVGTPRAISIIQQYAEKGQDRNLAETTLADEDYPVLSEMHDRWENVPPVQRTRDNLITIVQSGCNQRGVLAAYWLGFFAPNPDSKKEAAELEALEGITRTNTPTCEMMEHVIALKSLALRSAETVDYWKRLAQKTPNVWERHQIVINAWGRWGEKFAPVALDLLKTDTAQYVEWELLNGNLETRQGREYRNYWDIWIPADVLTVLEFDDTPGRRTMKPAELDALLDWLEAGARPRDPVVLNHMIYHLAEFTSGDDTRRLLRVFDKLPDRNQNWWILQTLRDPAALPLLRYWSTLPAPKDKQELLERTIVTLANLSANRGSAAKLCCEATEECLLQHLRHREAANAATDIEIHSEEDARKWLDGATSAAEIKIRYVDELKRSAVVRLDGRAPEHWQYLYDCWRDMDTKSENLPAH
ncbi:MAG: hypothetical protein WA766_08490 [Candidatus Acidiferrales bacterium]|jgi:hypothetical protein